jgi:hypothetical protein
MAESDNNLNKIHCASCGVSFGIDKDVDKLWRGSHKSFWCPNGHSLSYSGPSAQEKELTELRAKVKTLEEELSTAKQSMHTQTTAIETLRSELEIWRPTTTDEN